MSQIGSVITASVAGVASVTAGTGLNLTGNAANPTINMDVPVTIAHGGTNAIAFATTDGTVYFDGNASLSDSGILYTTDIVGGRDTGLYLRIGDEALTSHSLNADDDMLVNGKLEVDGTAFFDGAVSVSSSGLILDGDATITTVIASPSCTSCVIGSLFIDTVLGTIHICDAANTCSLITVQ